jgi:aminoglycoside 3-N-acetyltransferase I
MTNEWHGADMADYQTRHLAPCDVPFVRQLNDLFAEAFDDTATYGEAPPSDEYLERALAKDDVIVLVALAAYELAKLEHEWSEIYIYDLAVAEPHRRRGIATRLIAHLRDIARERGTWVIYVQADYGDDPAIRLYSKLGVREDVVHFDIRP